MKAKNYCPEFEEYKTIRQWALLGQLPKKDAKGVELWANKNCQASYMYYSPDEVDPATEKELQDFFQPERDRKNKLARLNRKWHKEAEEKKRQEEQKKIFDEAVEAVSRYGIHISRIGAYKLIQSFLGSLFQLCYQMFFVQAFHLLSFGFH